MQPLRFAAFKHCILRRRKFNRIRIVEFHGMFLIAAFAFECFPIVLAHSGNLLFGHSVITKVSFCFRPFAFKLFLGLSMIIVHNTHANCELFELEELREPDSGFSQYAYDYAVEIPALGLCFRYGREAEVTMSAAGSRFAWIDDCLLVFDAVDRRYLGSCYDSVAAYADWYYREHPQLRHRYRIRPDAIADLDCRIELPYRIRQNGYTADVFEQEESL